MANPLEDGEMTEQELERQRAIARELIREAESLDEWLTNQLAHLTMADNNLQVHCVLFDLRTNFDNRGNVIGESKEWLEGTTYTQAEIGQVYDLLHKILHISCEHGWWTITELEPITTDLRSFDELQAEGYWE